MFIITIYQIDRHKADVGECLLMALDRHVEALADIGNSKQRIKSLIHIFLLLSGAIFLILELNQPLEGTIKVSSAPLHKALLLIGK
jgi:hypothetical protein